MAAGTLTDIPLDRIQAEAAQIKFGRTVLSLVAWALYWAGWGAGKLMTVVIWKSVAFTVASVRVGWVEAAGPSKRSQIQQLKRTIAEQQMQLSRVLGPS